LAVLRTQEQRDKQNGYHRDYSARHYKENKQYYIDKAHRHDLKKRARFREYKETLECQVCGEDHPATIQFHHRDPSEKEVDISRVAQNWGWERLMKEVAKCDILCANCHAKLHSRY
jgi:hypothetical protein